MAGALIKIDEVIVSSAVSSVSLGGANWDSSYDVYKVIMENVTPTVDSNLDMRVLASSSVTLEQEQMKHIMEYNIFLTLIIQVSIVFIHLKLAF